MWRTDTSDTSEIIRKRICIFLNSSASGENEMSMR